MISATKRITSKKIQCLAFMIPMLIPAVHIFILQKFWSYYTYNVNKEDCRCSCWDTVFKGILSHSYLIFKILFKRTQIYLYLKLKVHMKRVLHGTNICILMPLVIHSKCGH